MDTKSKRFISLIPILSMMLFLSPVLSNPALAAETTDWDSVTSFAPETSYYIATASDLKAFASLVNNGQNGAGITFILTKDIFQNDETFTFDKASGIVAVSDGTNYGYLGTGIPGTLNHTGAASSVVSSGGAFYTADALTSDALDALDSVDSVTYAGIMDAWTPIGDHGVTGFSYNDATEEAKSLDLLNNWDSSYDSYYISDGKGGYKKATLSYDKDATYYTRESVYASFAGTFDGGGHSVSGLYLNYGSSYDPSYDSSYCGLFGSVDGAAIKNVSIVNSYIWNDDHSTGGIVGSFGSTTPSSIDNCRNGATVSSDSNDTGGIAGSFRGSITNCFNTGNVKGATACGGIAGTSGDDGSVIAGCANSGDIYSPLGDFIGGIAGGSSADVINCSNTGTVIGHTNTVGGLLGGGHGIINSYNTGAVTGGTNYVGGIAGQAFTVTNCFNAGQVTGSGAQIGGIVGLIIGESVTDEVKNSYYLAGCATDGIGQKQKGIGGSFVLTASEPSDFSTEYAHYYTNGWAYAPLETQMTWEEGKYYTIGTKEDVWTGSTCYTTNFSGTGTASVIAGVDGASITDSSGASGVGIAGQANLKTALNAWINAADADDFKTWMNTESYPVFGSAPDVIPPQESKKSGRVNTDIVKIRGIPYYLDSDGNQVWIGLSTDSGSFIEKQHVTVFFGDNIKPYSDLPNDWSMRGINFVTARELFLGTDSDRFSPRTGMTRAMFATVLGRLYERSYGTIQPVPSESFIDCDYSSKSWYARYAEWAGGNRIICGYGDGRFGPEDMITREQMADILYRFAGFMKFLPTQTEGPLAYSDSADISTWAVDGALFCQSEDIITGRGINAFCPQEKASRAEAATTIKRFIEYSISKFVIKS